MQATWLSSRVSWGRVRIRSRLEQVEREALQVWAEVLAINQDSRPLESISALWEEEEEQQPDIQRVAETEGAAEVVRQERRVRAELLELALRRV